MPKKSACGRRSACGSSWPLAAAAAGNRRAAIASKFGLTVSEILHAVDELKSRDMLDCFKLLHFHLGSQITNIRHVKTARDRSGPGLCRSVQARGGAGIPRYRRRLGRRLRRLANEFRIERQLHAQEYANDVVHHVQAVCEEAVVPHPTIISESGRAVAAYHACLVFGTLGVAGQGNGDENLLEIPRRFRAAAARSGRYVQERHRPQRAGKLSRRPAGDGCGDDAVLRPATCRSISGPWPRICSGPSAARSSG